MNAIASIAGDYQQFDLDAEGRVVAAGARMTAKLEALAATGLATDFVTGKSVLDVGTDHGFFAFMASTAGARSVLALDRNRDVKGRGRVDLIEQNTALARRFHLHDRVQFRAINLGQQWHEYGQFDVVFAMSVLHHVYANCGDLKSVFYWLARHTIPGGLLIWEGPTDSRDPVVVKDVPSHLHAGYTETALAEAVQAHFEIIRRGPALHEPTRQIWICRRRETGTGTVLTSYHLMDGAKGATKAFELDGGRRMDEIEHALGVRPIPGSLNLVTRQIVDWDRNYYRARILDSTNRRDPVAPWANRWCRFYPAMIANVGGWAMRFEGENYPDYFVELIAPYRLRDLVPDGDMTQVDGVWYPAGDLMCASAVARDVDKDIGHALLMCPGRQLIVQAGGNVGVYPERLAQHFDKVVTFEPDPANFACMMKNVTHPNVDAIHAALGADAEGVALQQFAHNCGASRVSGKGDIPCVRVDDLSLPACDMIWLDVEGSELDALKGSTETMRRHRPVIRFEDGVPLEMRGISASAIIAWLAAEFGYKIVDRVGRDVVLAC